MGAAAHCRVGHGIMMRPSYFYDYGSPVFGEGSWGLEIRGAGRFTAHRPSPPFEAVEMAPPVRHGLPFTGCPGTGCASWLPPLLRAPSPGRLPIYPLCTRSGSTGPRSASAQQRRGRPSAQSRARSSRVCWHAAQQSVGHSVVPRTGSAPRTEQ
ncbi:hypothetical protein NDU88_007381 [Pleurodeles waltl]|uniref:Uncharacterized protein n=1 Tax=Pleurodeles waltl TaxID=8319 RepID=A0AAV7RUY0_PLEWA|nr:hypothetical protein NDU88_007381 [Pleurodeles waltl]